MQTTLVSERAALGTVYGRPEDNETEASTDSESELARPLWPFQLRLARPLRLWLFGAADARFPQWGSQNVALVAHMPRRSVSAYARRSVPPLRTA